MSHAPVRVPHHGNKEVEHEQSGDNSEGRVGDAVHEGQVHLVVGRTVDNGEEELKSAEERHGIVVEMAQFIRVFRLEDDIKRWQKSKRKRMRFEGWPVLNIRHVQSGSAAHLPVEGLGAMLQPHCATRTPAFLTGFAHSCLLFLMLDIPSQKHVWVVVTLHTILQPFL